LYQKSLDYGPAAKLAGDVQWTETGRILHIDGRCIGRQQNIETRQLVGKLHRSVVRRRSVARTCCKQVIHLAAWATHNDNKTHTTL